MRIAAVQFVSLVVLALVGCASTGQDRISSLSRDPSQLVPLSTVEFQVDMVPIRRVDHRGSVPPQSFATYGQCQVDLPTKEVKETALPAMAEENEAKIRACLATAERERVNVLILPELSLAFEEGSRHALIDELKGAARRNSMVIVAGSYYDSQRFSRLVVIGPDWYEEGYKVHPSRYEASPRYGLGMRPGVELLLLDTPYGRILPLTCVDLISDAIQYQARSLANRGQLDVLVNLNYNPAGWEFLVEANSIARRHPVFVTLTNIAAWPSTKETCRKTGDSGFCGGNTALFGSIRSETKDCPNCIQTLMPKIPSSFVSGGKRSVPYDTLVAVIPPLQEALLVYELNLRLLREPLNTNAPDQGYPTIRNVRSLPLQ
jgi:predicted amidohydrolase